MTTNKMTSDNKMTSNKMTSDSAVSAGSEIQQPNITHLSAGVDSNLAIAQTIAKAMDALAMDALATNGQPIALYLSGGSTPGPIYKALADMPRDWANTHLALVDERWVDEADAGSNAALIKSTLLQSHGASAHFVPMKNSAETPFAGAQQLNEVYAGLPKPSIAILGMGPDGHTASWFANADGLDVALDAHSSQYVCGIEAIKTKVTGDYLQRMTMTRHALEACNHLFLIISGEEKWSLLEPILAGSASDLPVATLIQCAGNKLHIFVLDGGVNA